MTITIIFSSKTLFEGKNSHRHNSVEIQSQVRTPLDCRLSQIITETTKEMVGSQKCCLGICNRGNIFAYRPFLH